MRMNGNDNIVEEVMSKNDIVDVVSSYVKLSRKGNSYFGLCPFHNEKSASFSVSPNKQMFYCFGCGEGGNVYSFIMKYENCTFGEALKQLADRAGVELPEYSQSEEQKAQKDLRLKMYEVNKEAALYYYRQLKSERGAKGLAYFKNRGLSDETITGFGLGYAPMQSDALYQHLKAKGYDNELLKETGLVRFDEKRGAYDTFFNRVMFPIMNAAGKVIGFGGRVMGDGTPKYLNSSENKLFDKRRNLYGLNVAKSTREKNVIICEGYMDVIALHQAGFKQAVASLGTAFTSEQADLLKRFTSEVYLTYDSDGAGTKAALRAIPMLRNVGITVKVINMKPYKDPDEFIKALGVDEFKERMRTAMGGFMFEIKQLENDYNFNNPEEQNKFYLAIRDKILLFPTSLERNTYIDAVSKEYNIPTEELKQLVNNKGNDLGLVKNVVKKDTKKIAKQDDPILIAQKMLLTWLVNEPELFNKVSAYVKPEDFIEPLYNFVATKLYEQFEKETLAPANIINMIENDEDHKEVAAIFNAELGADLNKNEKESAINELVLKVKLNSLDYRTKNANGDLSILQELIYERGKIQKMHIYL